MDILQVERSRNYEAVIIMDPRATEEEQKDLFRKNKAIIESFKGSVNHLDTWGSRSLGNPIDKLSRGVYFHTTFVADPACITELERTMKINEKILRYMHTRLDERSSIEKHLENFREVISESNKRIEEREAKIAKKKDSRKPFRKPSK